MSNAALQYPSMTREDRYHEALRAFLKTSAAYLEIDLLSGGLANTPQLKDSTVDAAASC